MSFDALADMDNTAGRIESGFNRSEPITAAIASARRLCKPLRRDSCRAREISANVARVGRQPGDMPLTLSGQVEVSVIRESNTRNRQMKPGRNDPCPCGSGKKYKHCCLSAGSVPPAAPADLTWRRLRALLDGFAPEMLRFTTEAYGSLALHEAWDVFTGPDDLEFDPNTPLMQLFMPWFFHCWAPDPVATKVVNKSLHDVIPTAAYLSTKGRGLDPLLRRYLDSLLTAPFTFFEVLACDPGTGMTLRDVMTQEEHAVTERGASQGMQPGDLLFGQLASVDRLTMLEACNGFAIPPMEKAPIIELRAQIASAYPVITHQVLRDWDFELLDLFLKLPIASTIRDCRRCRTPTANHFRCTSSCSTSMPRHRPRLMR